MNFLVITWHFPYRPDMDRGLVPGRNKKFHDITHLSHNFMIYNPFMTYLKIKI